MIAFFKKRELSFIEVQKEFGVFFSLVVLKTCFVVKNNKIPIT